MELLPDLVLVVLTATVMVAILHRLRLPSILGFLLCGLLVGPIGFGLVTDSHEIHVMAEFGVVLLMFTIGLEISIADLVRMGKRVFFGGLGQIGATTLLFGLGASWAGLPIREAITVGLLLAASSTALVLRVLGDRGELSTSYGQLSLAILLMQDFAVVGLMLVVPMLASTDVASGAIMFSIGRALLFALAIFFVARFAFPWLLRRLVELRSREVFLLATLLAVFGTAWVAEEAGLSLALGAFIAGLVVSESEFSHQMFAEVLPFRDVFNGLFFVSIGLLLHPEILGDFIGEIAAAILVVLVAKGVIVMAVAKAFRLSWSNAFLAGVALAQVGEFGLVLAQLASSLELLNERQHGVFIAVSVATMTLTPLLLVVARWIVRRSAIDVPEVDPQIAEHLEGHVIVVGFGLNGRNVARALALLDVPHVIVEMNAATVERERAAGRPIVFGNATRPALLHHLGVEKARALVAAVADAAATREIVANAHHANPNMEIIARTRYIAEMEPLAALGATQVIPEEFETSIELVARVMRTYGASNRAVESETRRLRQAQYTALLGGTSDEDAHPISELLSSLEVEKLTIADESPVIGKSLRDVDLRANTGATVLAVFRPHQQATLTPSPDFVFVGGDIAVVAGDASAILDAALIFDPNHEKDLR